MNPVLAMARLTFLVFVFVSLVLPFFSFEGYSIVENTTSHLGAQRSPHAWFMNVTFIALGLAASIVLAKTQSLYHQVIGVCFGISLLLTGVFRHAPLLGGIPVDVFHDQLHSVFASTTGFMFTFLAVGHGFMTRGRQRLFGFSLAGIAIVVSLGMWVAPDFMGLLQRFMFFSAFWWLFFYMRPPKDLRAKKHGSSLNG